MKHINSAYRAPVKDAPLLQLGFTLLEVLLALGLSLTLLGILYTALDIHFRFSNIGQTEIERAQVARAVFNKMSSDIRSVVWNSQSSGDGAALPEGEEGEDESSEDDTAAEVAEVVSEIADPSEAYAGDSLGVFGDSETLVLHIIKPNRKAITNPNADNPNEQSLMQSVSYFLAGGNGALQQMVGQQLAESTLDRDTQGLVRMAGDRITMVEADANGDLETMAAGAKVLAEEIEYIAFEYFDGIEWVAEWDSETMGAIPTAIGITIRFRDPEYPPGAINAQIPSSMTKEFRMVVAVGAANAFENLAF